MSGYRVAQIGILTVIVYAVAAYLSFIC